MNKELLVLSARHGTNAQYCHPRRPQPACVECWSDDLIGDAAHAVAPHSGQGASMALQDAQLLAKLLRESQSAAVDRVFAEFERQRRPRTDKVIALGGMCKERR